MRCWALGCVWVVLAVAWSATSARADSTSWVATETTVEANATTQSYFWAFVGPTDFTVQGTFFKSPGESDFLLLAVSGPSVEDILGNGIPDQTQISDMVRQLAGFAGSSTGPCSASNFPALRTGRGECLSGDLRLDAHQHSGRASGLQSKFLANPA